ncbi:hypothetical protein HanIR_Chr09g0438761 [Helianthus annuus]|nr:hypothetical protein HanIR_Chr09g0438761 [Helianthus annuus]
MNAANTINCSIPKKHWYDVKESRAGYFFKTGACNTNHPDHDKQWPIKYTHPNVQLFPLASPRELSSGDISRTLFSEGDGLYIVGPLYRVITDAPAMQNRVPKTLDRPSFLSSLTFSILEL